MLLVHCLVLSSMRRCVCITIIVLLVALVCFYLVSFFVQILFFLILIWILASCCYLQCHQDGKLSYMFSTLIRFEWLATT